MSATCLDIVTYAMRQARLIGPGRTPKGAEADEGMVALQSFYDELRTNAMFGRLKDTYLTADATAQEGRRYRLAAGVTLTDATSDYTPDSCDDYGSDCCDYGSGGVGAMREPRDLALYEVVHSDGTQFVKLYDRTQWVDLLDLTLEDIAPLSGRSAYGLAAALCVSGAFVSVFGGEPSATVVALANRFLGSLSAKYGSSHPPDHSYGEYM
jgi:hypothetical protein